MTDAAFKLLLLFFPGVIAYKIFEALTPRTKRELYEIILIGFIFGVISYSAYAIIGWVLTWIVFRFGGPNPRGVFDALSGLISSEGQIKFSSVFFASLASLPLSYLAIGLHNRKSLINFARRLNITKVPGYQDTWSYFFESMPVQWVIVRDLENDLSYQGEVRSYSSTFEKNELILRQVRVSKNSTGDFLYEMDAIYITRPCDKITIEVQKLAQ